VAAGARLGPLESDQLALAGILTIVSLGLWSAAAIVGRYLGKRSLAPLVAMAAAARAMPFADGHSRLPSPGTRDELELFASSFNGLLDRLHEALERQKQFTGQASHQLRTPLAGVITAIEVARRRDRSAAQLEQVLDRVHDDALRLWRVIESLLFLARADAEAGLPDLERIDLTSWIGEHLARWSEHERAPDIEFRADPDHGNEAVVVRAHAGLLAQLLDNLLENACKYSASGAEITIRAHADQAWGYLTVADRGRGIAADDLSRVFEPFYRSSESARRGDAGVGLGLAVVRRIATSVGGSVSVESEPGRGSRFVVRLPRFAENRAPVKATEVEC
jgi:signal transduction histidine kinase